MCHPVKTSIKTDFVQEYPFGFWNQQCFLSSSSDLFHNLTTSSFAEPVFLLLAIGRGFGTTVYTRTCWYSMVEYNLTTGRPIWSWTRFCWLELWWISLYSKFCLGSWEYGRRVLAAGTPKLKLTKLSNPEMAAVTVRLWRLGIYNQLHNRNCLLLKPQ